MASAYWTTGALCALGIAAGWQAIGLRDEVNPPARVAGLEASETHASASLLGQFRTSTSSWLWLRTDLYLHNGVEMRPLTEMEQRGGRKGVGSSDQDLSKVMNDDNIVTSIPSPDRDFRGLFGDLERATAPYHGMEGHTHNDPKQALPLFRLMTWLDPNFVDGWTAGATVIARQRDEEGTRKALDFLNEGLKANPASIAIHNDIAFIYITRRKDLKTAVRYLESAHEAGKRNAAVLGEEDKEELAQVYRWLALCYRNLGRYDSMHAILEEGAALFPDDGVIEQLRNQPPSFLTEKGQKIWQQERDAKAAAEVAASHEEAREIH